MHPLFYITLAVDIGDFIWLIFVVIMVIGSVISSIFKAIKETAEKNKRRQMMERDASQVGPGQGPRTASQRIQELAEQRRKQLEQMAAERRRQLEEMARQRQGGAGGPTAPTRQAPAPAAESEYDRQMRQRQEAARQHQQELERRREQDRAAAQQRQQELERRRAEAARQSAPRPRKAAPAPVPSRPQPAPVRQDTSYRKLEVTDEITADMIVRDEAPGHEEPVHRHVQDVPHAKPRAKGRVAVPRLDHPTRLRQAIMIKEILDRPLALRDGEDDAYRW